eukprot:5005115-Lingulodinium_polyedra.AAC.1
MDLEAKMNKFRESQGQEPLELSHAEQKRLASKYNYQLEKSGARSVVESQLSGLGKGQKQAGYQACVRSWILAGGFNEKFLTMVNSMEFGR